MGGARGSLTDQEQIALSLIVGGASGRGQRGDDEETRTAHEASLWDR
jgi:hypothetical protein